MNMKKKIPVKELPKSNVVLFPTSRIVNPAMTALHSTEVPQTLEQIKDATYLIKINKVNQIMEVMMPLIVQGLVAHGINLMNISSDEELKNCVFMVEAIRSYIYKHYELKHPCQALAENVFNLQDGIVSLNNIKVKETETANTSANN